MITLPASIIPSMFIASDALNQPQPAVRQLNYQPFGRAIEQYPVASDRRRRRELNRLAKLPRPYAPLPEYGDWPAQQYEPTPMSLRLREPIVGVSDWNAYPVGDRMLFIARKTKGYSGIAHYDNGQVAIDGKSTYAIPSQAQLDYNRTIADLSSVLVLPAPGQTTFGSWTSNKQIKAIKRQLADHPQIGGTRHENACSGKSGNWSSYNRSIAEQGKALYLHGQPVVAAHAQGL